MMVGEPAEARTWLLRKRTRGAALSVMPLFAMVAAGAQAQVETAKPASSYTAEKNAELLQQLPFGDRLDFEEAQRGLIEPLREPIRDAAGKIVWDMGAYDFLKADKGPDTVNPSLWRHARLNTNAGLYRVTDRVYQLRGFDLANMTVIEGDTGLVLVDPMSTVETAREGLEVYFRHRPRRSVVAVIHTHTHLDHIGGVRGVVDESDVRAGRVQIIVPAGFLKEAVSENVLAGPAMFRRAQYQTATPVPRGPSGQVDTGLGKGAPGPGTVTLMAPTTVIEKPYETHVIDGVEFEFQLTPGTEAPAEMNFYLPQMRALGMAENVVRTMHNILTPRGALVRDAKAWGQFIDASLVRYGDRSDVMFAQHSWPSWGGDRIRTILADQRDMYTYLNNHALHLLNQGLTPTEIGDAMRDLPGELAQKWYARGYYGAVSFNARAVYQRYLGFYDANPANLDPLPPVEMSKRYVAALGGGPRVVELMRTAIAAGDYRWAVEIGNRLVFAEPDNKEARGLQADALEQLGYQAESALWRNMYLAGAAELRSGRATPSGRNAGDLVRALEPAMYFDLLGVRLNSERAVGHDMLLNWIFSDMKQSFALTLHSGVLTYRAGMQHPRADATITMDKATLDRIGLRELDFAKATEQGLVKVGGKAGKLAELMGLMDNFDPAFAIVTP
ncbi:MAG: MBL fold metallo-hydrolase [Sphingopyxis sp.]|nr:MBL fold metallo-hydrolase [Sphingopyxis sp.]